MVTIPFRRREDLDELFNGDDSMDSGFNRAIANRPKVQHLSQKYTTHRNAAEPTSGWGKHIIQRVKEPQRQEIPPEFTTAQTILTPDNSKDATIHFDMDVADDVGALLEEFSRLKKLGHFQAASLYFDEHLRAFTDIVPVTIEYADMLIEQGVYQQLDDFLQLHRDILNQDIWADGKWMDERRYKYLYQANLQLIDAFASMHLTTDMEKPYKKVQNIARYMRLLSEGHPAPTSLDSAEVQVFRYALKIMSRIEKETDIIPEREFNYWANCDHLYTPLIMGGQVWDARDLICALIESEGAKNVWNILFQTDINSSNAFSRLIADWNMGQYDESTYLAILDILVHVSGALSSFTIAAPTREDLSTADRCLDYARSVAICLKENNPELKHCRPYLSWVLAETQLRRKRHPADSDLGTHLSTYPGLTVRMNTLPIYLPITSENPTWFPSSRHPGVALTPDDQLLEAVVETAQAREDYATEVACIAELTYRFAGGQDVWAQRFSRMQELQLTRQHDILGYQHTCLTRFLTTVDDQDRRALLSDIKATKGHSSQKGHSPVFLTGWCLRVMGNALALHTGGLTAHALSTADVDPWLVDLPTYVKDQLSHRGLEQAFALDLYSADHFRPRERRRAQSRDRWPEYRTKVLAPRRTVSYDRIRPEETVIRRDLSTRKLSAKSSEHTAIVPENNSSSKTDDENPSSALVPVSPVLTRPERVERPDDLQMNPPTRRSTVEAVVDSESE
ncbi:hypothetical protein BJX63DRAFT_432846 [Aspergillus granulosus]|uniref:Uncharacterized protein n=1 Tax=Aspergillus granulosus TaxID=176169 RepID=A0ABR4HAF7_9EURO